MNATKPESLSARKYLSKRRTKYSSTSIITVRAVTLGDTSDTFSFAVSSIVSLTLNESHTCTMQVCAIVLMIASCNGRVRFCSVHLTCIMTRFSCQAVFSFVCRFVLRSTNTDNVCNNSANVYTQPVVVCQY